MQRVITASFTSAIPKSAPGEIVYIPVGSHKINATVSGKPGEITVNLPVDKGAAIAASLQKALETRLAGTVRPRLAFDHSRTGPASGHPSSFSFDPSRGIILSASWSNSGRAAIEGGDYGYFSPTFLIDDDGTPSGLPDKGEIGSLVDEPAFRAIGLIAAADVDLNPESKPSNTMSKLIFAALAISAAAENAETEAVKAIEKLKNDHQTVSAANTALQTENDALKKKVEAADAEAKKARKERADTLVRAAIADGRILPKDEEKATKFRDKIEAGDAFAEEILAQLPKLNLGLEKAIVVDKDGKTVSASEHAFVIEARKLVTASEAKDETEAYGILSSRRPDLYADFNKQFHG